MLNSTESRKISSIAAAMLLLQQCAALLPVRAAVLEDTVAIVNGQPILLSEYQKDVDAVMENWKRGAPGLLGDKVAVAELRRKVLDQMVDNNLLQQEAEKRKIKIHDRELDNGIAEVKDRNFRHDEAGKVLSDEEVEKVLDVEL